MLHRLKTEPQAQGAYSMMASVSQIQTFLMARTLPDQTIRTSLCAFLGLAAALITTSCSQSADLSASLYQKAQAAETSNDLNSAKKYYLECVTASQESKSSYFQLAAVNRLCALEKTNNNVTKARTYLNEAGALADACTANDTGSSAAQSELTRERYFAYMQLGNWHFEDGLYESARKAYNKAVTLEAQLKIAPDSETSAAGRIKSLEPLANGEQSQVFQSLENSMKRAPESKTKTDRDSQLIKYVYSSAENFRRFGGSQLSVNLLKALGRVRSEYGIRHESYRSCFEVTAGTLLQRRDFDRLTLLLEDDMKEFAEFSQADLDDTRPEAVENATFYSKDLLLMAKSFEHRRQWKEMLACCQKTQNTSAKVFTTDSPDERYFLETLAIAQDNNHLPDEALQTRKRLLHSFKTSSKDSETYANALMLQGLKLTEVERYNEAERLFEEAHRMCGKLKNNEIKAHLLVAYSDLLRRQGKNPKAREIALEAVPYCKASQDQMILLNCYSLLCLESTAISPEAALRYAEMSLALLQKNGRAFASKNINLAVQPYFDAANLNRVLGNNREAMRYADEGLELIKGAKHQPPELMVALYGVKADIFREYRNWKQEAICRERSIDFARLIKQPVPVLLAYPLFVAGLRQQENGNFDAAEKHLREAMALTKNEPSLKQLNLNCKAGLGWGLAKSRRDISQASNIKTELLKEYKSTFGANVGDNGVFCVRISDLCYALNDKKNSLLLLDEAQSILSKDKNLIKAWAPTIAHHKRSVQSMND
jgi:tetratricopeptide (TPR) repeat protein